MIFVTLGSQKFQFNRLLIEIDRLVEDGLIKEDVFAQIGYSDYKPRNYKYKEFLDRKEFSGKMKEANIVITHGGTGAIIGAIKQKKKVIAVPRLSGFKEHVDDHQIEITNQFKSMNLILSINDVKLLNEALNEINEIRLNEYMSNTENIINEIENFIAHQN